MLTNDKVLLMSIFLVHCINKVVIIQPLDPIEELYNQNQIVL